MSARAVKERAHKLGSDIQRPCDAVDVLAAVMRCARLHDEPTMVRPARYANLVVRVPGDKVHDIDRWGGGPNNTNKKTCVPTFDDRANEYCQ